MSPAIAVLVGSAAAVTGLCLLGLKWDIRIRIVLLWSAAAAAAGALPSWAISSAAGLAAWQTLLMVPVIAGALSAATLAWRFFRDPERVPPSQAGIVVSPADGQVIYVRKFEPGAAAASEKKRASFPLSELVPAELLTHGTWVIGICMTYLDVHVNRAPIAGKITHIRHVPGRFHSLRRPEAEFLNERMLTVIDGGWLQVGIVQIASRLVRRIVGYVSEGTAVGLAQRIGKITLGSQVDLVFTGGRGLNVVVRPGLQLKAGESIIAARKGGSEGRGSRKGDAT